MGTGPDSRLVLTLPLQADAGPQWSVLYTASPSATGSPVGTPPRGCGQDGSRPLAVLSSSSLDTVPILKSQSAVGSHLWGS